MRLNRGDAIEMGISADSDSMIYVEYSPNFRGHGFLANCGFLYNRYSVELWAEPCIGGDESIPIEVQYLTTEMCVAQQLVCSGMIEHWKRGAC